MCAARVTREPRKAGKTRREQLLERLERRDLMSADLFVDALPEHPVEMQIEAMSEQFAGYGSSAVDFARDNLGLIGLGQTVAIVDSGIAYDHYALGGGFGSNYRVVGGWDFAENDPDPYDDAPVGFHGTHVAGTVASNDARFAGVAPGADLVSLRVFDDHGNGSFEWIEQALQWVHQHRGSFEHPLTTVNLSVGSDWNGQDIPDWAILEDEFAQLKADGIFISVAAGNNFRTVQTTGLNYPAVSSHVVPVASANSLGKLSDFSQRNDRVIVAPGEHVTSTAPDYLYGFDGVTDDFVAASGTSMAAPFVAGASVLIREAWQIAGLDSATQDDIYHHMLATSDSVFDPATGGTYARLNLKHALEQALPQDEFGDTSMTAYSLGTLLTTRSVAGMYTSHTDNDVFSFVAGQSGTVVVDTEGADYADSAVRMFGSSLPATDHLEFEVVAGQSYTFALSTLAGIGNYRAAVTLSAELPHNNSAPTTDLGSVTTRSFQQVATDMGSHFYLLKAGHTGILTASASGPRLGSLEVLDARGQLLSAAEFTNGKVRLDIEATQGEQYQLRIQGIEESADIRLTNLLAVDGANIDLFATSAKDRFIVRAGNVISVTVNNESYRIERDDSAVPTSIDMLEATPEDEIWVFGSEGNDMAELRHDSAHIRSTEYDIHLRGSRRYSLMGRGGDDSVTLFDSASNDTFVGRREFVLMTGGSQRHLARDFEAVTVRATSGGDDLALLYDGEGNDAMRLSAEAGEIQYADGAKIQTTMFPRVQGFASLGNNALSIVDSTGDDHLIARPDATMIEGTNYRHTARGFQEVVAQWHGGTDRVVLYDSAGNDQLMVSADTVSLRGVGFSVTVHDYEAVGALADSGVDTAIFRDTPDDETFIGMQRLMILEGAGFRHVANGFDQATAIASQGEDLAILYAAATGLDSFASNGILQSITGDEYSTAVAAFDDVVVLGETGGVQPSTNSPSPSPSHSRFTPERQAAGVIHVSGDPSLTRLSAGIVDRHLMRIALASDLSPGLSTHGSHASVEIIDIHVDHLFVDHAAMDDSSTVDRLAEQNVRESLKDHEADAQQALTVALDEFARGI